MERLKDGRFVVTQPHCDLEKRPKSRVELHIHYDGSVRHSTIIELINEKKRENIHNIDSLEDLQSKLFIETPTNLRDFLHRFHIYMPLIIDDEEVIERIAYEFCEDQAAQGVYYTEVRYSPHIFCSSGLHCPIDDQTICHAPESTPEGAVQAVNKGIDRGQRDFGIKVRSILCCIQGHENWCRDVLDLAIKYRDHVVGIDIAGDEDRIDKVGEVPFGSIEKEIFQEAARVGIHRTVHSGEFGPAKNVKFALDELKAERIGHGYRVIQDTDLYQRCLEERVHFECCPYSSILTGSVPISVKKHPIVKFAEDGLDYSISKDDPTITQTTTHHEYRFLMDMGLTERDLVKANLNAAKSCFLPPQEKESLINHILGQYVEDDIKFNLQT